MFDGDGSETLELQAFKIAVNSSIYGGSSPCPTCGVIMNPVEFMYSKGVCPPCYETKMQKRIKGKMV
jgi:hypothetical protein